MRLVDEETEDTTASKKQQLGFLQTLKQKVCLPPCPTAAAAASRERRARRRCSAAPPSSLYFSLSVRLSGSLSLTLSLSLLTHSLTHSHTQGLALSYWQTVHACICMHSDINIQTCSHDFMCEVCQPFLHIGLSMARPRT